MSQVVLLFARMDLRDIEGIGSEHIKAFNAAANTITPAVKLTISSVRHTPRLSNRKRMERRPRLSDLVTSF